MAARPTSWLVRPALLRTLISHCRLAVRLVREPRVPWLAKVLPLLTVGYVVFPLDFVPDVLPIIGQIDDVGLALLGLEAFLRLCPLETVAFHRAAIEGRRKYSPMHPPPDIIDAEWRRE